MEQFTFTWKIENYHFNTLQKGEGLKSPLFVAGTLHQTSWFFEIFPMGKSPTFDRCECFLNRADTRLENICISFTIEISGNEGKFFECFEANNIDFGLRGTKEMENFVELTPLMDEMENWKEKILTIQCQMVGLIKQTTTNPSLECVTKTKIGVDECSFKLEANFDSLSSGRLHMFNLPLAFIGLTIFKKVIKIKVHNNLAPLQISCEISLMDVNGVEQDSRKVKHLFSTNSENNTCEFPSFTEKSKLQLEKSKYLRNGTFDLMLKIFSSNGKTLEVTKNYYYNIPARMKSRSLKDSLTILKDFKRMYLENIQSDIKLRAENQTFSAHKSVLAARSPVFESMFNNDMLENQIGVVDIPDVEAKILDYFLLFMYSGTVDNMDYENAIKLLIVADKYQVPTLKKDCAVFLKSILCTKNVCDVLGVSYMIEYEELKASAVKYAISHADALFSSDIWFRFIENHAKTATDVLIKFSIECIKKQRN